VGDISFPAHRVQDISLVSPDRYVLMVPARDISDTEYRVNGTRICFEREACVRDISFPAEGPDTDMLPGAAGHHPPHGTFPSFPAHASDISHNV
jgi:hypothetical protein